MAKQLMHDIKNDVCMWISGDLADAVNAKPLEERLGIEIVYPEDARYKGFAETADVFSSLIDLSEIELHGDDRQAPLR